MAELSDELRHQLDDLLHSEHVVLFMKGMPNAPKCGFSARAVQLVGAWLNEYVAVDVLASPGLFDGLKAYGDWPTLPQLWVDGKLIGGTDIMESLQADGELGKILGAVTPAGKRKPVVHVSDAARQRIKDALEGELLPIRMRIDEAFQYSFDDVGERAESDIQLQDNGLVIVLDAQSAERADGMLLDVAPDGSGFFVDNPNEPATVHEIDAPDLAQWMQSDDNPPLLLDARTAEERAIASIPGSILLDQAQLDAMFDLPRDTPIVCACHHGSRSLEAAHHLLSLGFRKVMNLSGGIDAWSIQVDPLVPRY